MLSRPPITIDDKPASSYPHTDVIGDIEAVLEAEQKYIEQHGVTAYEVVCAQKKRADELILEDMARTNWVLNPESRVYHEVDNDTREEW